MMSDTEVLELRRDTLKKTLVETRAQLEARAEERAETLEGLTKKRDDFTAEVRELEAELETLEGELFAITERWKTARDEAARAKAHASQLG